MAFADPIDELISAGLGAVDACAEQPVLAPDDERVDRILCTVLVDGEAVASEAEE